MGRGSGEGPAAVVSREADWRRAEWPGFCPLLPAFCCPPRRPANVGGEEKKTLPISKDRFSFTFSIRLALQISTFSVFVLLGGADLAVGGAVALSPPAQRRRVREGRDPALSCAARARRSARELDGLPMPRCAGAQTQKPSPRVPRKARRHASDSWGNGSARTTSIRPECQPQARRCGAEYLFVLDVRQPWRQHVEHCDRQIIYGRP